MAKARNIVFTIGFVAAFIFICVDSFFYARKRIANRQRPGTATQKNSGSPEDGARPDGPGGGASHSRSGTSRRPGKTSTGTGSSTHKGLRIGFKEKPDRKIGDKPFFTDMSNAGDSGRNIHQRHPGRKRKVVRYREHDNLPRGTISGTITDSSGSPIAGAQVGLFHASLRGKPRGEARSSANGRYAFGPKRTGKYSLHVSAVNYAPRIEPVEITASDTKKDIVLTGGVVLTGAVQTTDNAAVDVEVTAECIGWHGKVLIEAGKTYRLQNAPRGNIVITAESPSYVRAKTRIAVNSDEGEIAVPILLLLPGADIYGKITDETSGKGIPQAAIRVEAPGEGGAFSALADADGNFLLKGAPTGKALTLTFTSPGYVSKETPLHAISIAEKREINAALAPAPDIHGRVETWDKIPIEQALVTMYAEFGNITRSVTGHTDLNGEFSLAVPQEVSVTDTEFSLLAKAYGFAPSIVRIEQGKEDESVVISLSPGCTLEGTVLGPDGSPVELASIRALPKNMDTTDTLRLKIETRSGREGRYELAAISPGAWSILFTYGTSAPKIINVTFQQTGEKNTMDIALNEGWRFEGSVTDEDGKPFPGVTVVLACINQLIKSRLTTSGSSGKFSFSGLGVFDYTLTLSRTGFEAIRDEEILQASPSATFVLKRK